MTSSKSETVAPRFVAAVKYYADPVHEAERRRLVRAAAALAATSQTWAARGAELLAAILRELGNGHRNSCQG